MSILELMIFSLAFVYSSSLIVCSRYASKSRICFSSRFFSSSLRFWAEGLMVCAFLGEYPLTASKAPANL